MHYPETFNGSISFAPICKSFGKSVTLQENPWKFAATDKIATIYWDANADASRKIKKTVRKLYDCIKDNTCEKSFSDMNLCTKPSGPEEWEALLNEIILEQYAEIPQFDYSNLDLQSLINATLSAKSSAEVLLAPINFALKKLNLTSSSQNCTDYQSLLTFISNVGIGPSWGYITCNWLPASLSAISPSNSLFPPRQVNDSTIYCTNPSFTGPDINNTNSYFEKKFGITDNELDKTRNLLIVNGAKDRTSAVCKPNLKEGNSRDKSRVLEVWDMSHGDSAFSESVLPRGKRGNVDAVRDMQLAYVMEWLGVSAEGEGGGY